MTLRILWRASPRKRFEKLETVDQARIGYALDRLSRGEVSADRLHGVLAGTFKLRVGDYRVLFEFGSGGDVIIVSLGHRGDVYRR